MGNYKETNLKGISLEEADLRNTDFSQADFSSSNLKKVQLDDSILFAANLSKVDLRGSSLYRANLREANLYMADLRDVNLEGCNLSEANLNRAILIGNQTLSKANLANASFEFSDLGGSDLSGLNLNRITFRGSNLFHTNLSRVQALNSSFQDVCLTGACIEDWNINEHTSLKNVQCKYVYLKYEKKERRPSAGSFEKGEFEILFKKAIETVDLIFTDGIDWEALFSSLKNLQEEYGLDRVSVQSIERKGGSDFLVRLEAPLELDKSIIETEVKAHYKMKLKNIESRYRKELSIKERELSRHRKQNMDLTAIVRTLSTKARGQVINLVSSSSSSSEAVSMQHSNQLRNVEVEMNINAPSTGIAGKVSGNQNVQANQTHKLLVDTSQDIESILLNLSQTYPTSTTSEQMIVAAKAVEEVENRPELKSRIAAVLSAGAAESLRELVNHPLINIFLASVKAWKASG